MGSLNAQRAASKVIEKVRKGQKVKYGEILLDVGYSRSVSKRPSKVTDTKAYKTALSLETMPIIEGLLTEINEIKMAMAGKDKGQEEYRILVGSLDILTKNYQLLSGGATERQVFVLPSEVIERNTISTDVNGMDGSTEPYKAIT